MATLLHYPLCAFSRSIRLALDECGIEGELAEERTGDWRPEFGALNPAGTLPVFITDERGPIVGAYAISEYLGDTADERDSRLFQPFPGDEGALAETRSWLAGNAMSFADLAAAAHLSTLDYLGEVPWEEHEPAKNWYALLKSRPSFRPLLQDRVAGFTPSGTYADLDF